MTRKFWAQVDSARELTELREALESVVHNATSTMGEDSGGWAYARIRQATLNQARTALGLPVVDEGSAAHHQPVTEAYLLGFERGRINAPRSEGDEYGGGSWTDDWRRGWDAGYEQWDGKRGFRDVF